MTGRSNEFGAARKRGAVFALAGLLLLAAGAAWSAPIHKYAAAGDLAKMKSLLSRQPKLVNARDAKGQTPLHIAAAAGRADVVAFLLKKGADAKVMDKSSRTPFSAAWLKGHKGIAESILAQIELKTVGRKLKPDETLPLSISIMNNLPPQPGGKDNGINVLIDSAHQCLFVGMWEWPEMLRGHGFRVVGSDASLDTVLTPGKPSRIRVPLSNQPPPSDLILHDTRAAGGLQQWRPFGWWPNPEYNVIVTYQVNYDAQEYLPEEIEAVRSFVNKGGGLVIVGGGPFNAERTEQFPLNELAKSFGARVTDKATKTGDANAAALALDDSWTVKTRGDNGEPVYATRTYGKGRIAFFSHLSMLSPAPDESVPDTAPKSRKSIGKLMGDTITWVAAGRKPVGGTRRLPLEAGGGGGIFPELETRVAGMAVYYAKNQKPELMDVVRESVPDVQKQVEAWMPSIKTESPMFFILAAGNGGGWAVNIYEPQEVGIISLSRDGILSVAAHEFAHQLFSGPANDKGQRAGILPWVHSEAHAIWFQRKIGQQRIAGRGYDPNYLFTFDKDGCTMDLAKVEEKDYRNAWNKLWWIWQKLDDRYGPTWYPRWLWVKNCRWEDNPKQDLTWDQVVEDMSIAVGEDLFPFFTKIGTTLKKDRFPRATFRGATMELSIAPLDTDRVGPACIDPIGDYRQPLKPTE